MHTYITGYTTVQIGTCTRNIYTSSADYCSTKYVSNVAPYRMMDDAIPMPHNDRLTCWKSSLLIGLEELMMTAVVVVVAAVVIVCYWQAS